MARQEAIATYDDSEVWNKKGEIQVGDKLEGFYIEHQTFTSKFGDGDSYIILCEDDKKKKIMGQADIRRKFEQIPVGSYVWVEFIGFKETDNGAMKEYKVEFDPDMKAD